jgi:hypothetical protein
MKRSFGLFAVVVVSVLATGAAGQSTGFVADIPFAFYVGDVELPAGSYWFTEEMGRKTLRVWGEEKGVYRFVQPRGSRRHSRSEVVFHKYPDGSHFLEEIWMPGQAGRQVMKSELEAKVSTDWRLKRIAVALRLATGSGPAGAGR